MLRSGRKCNSKIIFLSLFFLFSFPLYGDDKEEYRAAYALYRDGFYDVAARAFEEMAKQYPNSTLLYDALYYQALSLIKQNKIEDSLSPLYRLHSIKSFPYSNSVLYYLTLNHHLLQNYAESENFLSQLEPVEENLEKKEKLLYLSVKNNFFLNNQEKCKHKSREYIDTKGYKRYRIEILKLLIDTLLQEEDYNNAAIQMELLLSSKITESDRTTLYYNYLYALFMAGKEKDAITFFERTPISFSEELYFLMADLYYRSGDRDRAFKLLETIYTQTKSEKAVKQQAIIYYEKSEWEKALQLLEQRTVEKHFSFLKSDLAYKLRNHAKSLFYLKQTEITQMKREELLLYYELASHLNRTKELEHLIQNVELFAKLEKEERNFILYNLTVFSFDRGNYSNSVILMKRWLSEFSSDPLYEKILYMNGIALNHLRQYEEAIIEFAKIQKRNQKDKVYYEAFVDKGEAFFALREYGNAIRAYENYLSNKVSTERKQEVQLQLGNAYFNIKRYSKAYALYREYEKNYGNINQIQMKISETLLKKKDFKEAVQYFDDKTNMEAYPFFIYLYSCFNTGEYTKIIRQKENLTKYIKSKYYPEMLYTLILSCQKEKKEELLIPIYQENQHYLSQQKEETRISKALFSSFLKIRKLSQAKALFPSPPSDSSLLYFLGESYADTLYLKEACSFFSSFLEKKPEECSYSQMIKIYKTFSHAGEWDEALKTVQWLQEEFPNSMDPLLFRFQVLFQTQKEEQILSLLTSELLERDPLFYRFAEYSHQYLKTKQTKNYLRNLVSLLDKVDIDKLVVREILKTILNLSLESGNYKAGAAVIQKIPSSKMNQLDANFRFLEARLYEKGGDLEKALDLHLKLFYLYPSEVFWVEKSVRELMRIYQEQGETERMERIKKLFEEKYFILE